MKSRAIQLVVEGYYFWLVELIEKEKARSNYNRVALHSLFKEVEQEAFSYIDENPEGFTGTINKDYWIEQFKKLYEDNF